MQPTRRLTLGLGSYFALVLMNHGPHHEALLMLPVYAMLIPTTGLVILAGLSVPLNFLVDLLRRLWVHLTQHS